MAPHKPNPGRPRRVTIVMHHFVCDLDQSRYPRIADFDSRDYVCQIDYSRRHYEVVRMEDVVAAAHDPDLALPERALLLTFDDGYAYHADTVLPLLLRHGLQGSFFPPARASHPRAQLAPQAQERQVQASRDFLACIGCALDAWAMCYPFGGFDVSLLSILERHGCRAGLTTEVCITDLDAHHPLTPPRIDTNDLPRQADPPRNNWAVAAVTGALGPGADGDS